MKRIFFFLVIVFINNVNIFAQSELRQTLRIIVVDKFNKTPLEGVNVSSANSGVIGGTTNAAGELELQLTIGRYSFIYSYVGYQTYGSSDVIISMGKQTILNIELEEKKIAAKNVIIKAKKSKSKALNEINIISAKQFTTEEANRYAGSLGDPARMAQNFAGVVTNSDRRNDIVIRGNSPLGVSWRAEGIEIPNPNHFSGIGTTGGSVSILNNNNLSNSDFLTGAFAPQYGNATAGVFDLRLRTGNTKKHEHMFQFGLNGAELGTEGPLSKKNNSSYLLNARYSTLELFTKLGINLGANGTPNYQDFNFKINYPTKKLGTFALWAIAGNNTALSLSSGYDTTGTKLNPLPKGFNVQFNNWMSVAGLTHTYNITKNLVSKATITASWVGNKTIADSLFNNETEKKLWLNRLYNEKKINIAYQLSYKWNTNHQSQIGAYFTRSFLQVNDSILLTSYNRYLSILKFNGNTNLTRAYLQHTYKPNNILTIIGGLHAMHLNLNNTSSIEPRAAMQVSISPKWSAQIGTGLHYQTQALTTYYYNRTGNGSFIDSLTNLNLNFTKSKHLVVGTHYNINSQLHAKVEAYIQWLSQIPVEKIASSYSGVNDGAFYYNTTRPFLVNNGLAKNQGVEFTLEHFFNKGYYYLFTSSLYNSTYMGSDSLWRSTAFNGRYAVTMLGGYEFKIKKKNTLNFNLKLAFLGGKPYSPVDTAASIASGITRLNEAQANTLQYPNYFRPDIKISYRINAKRYAQEFGFNIDNFTNNQNVQSIEYDKVRNKIGFGYQVGFFPIVQYRIEF
jgi:hypothetical protein